MHVTQRRQTKGGTNYDSVETDYNPVGLPYEVTVPYTGTAGRTNSSATRTTTAYDALGRPLTVTDGGGGTTTYKYTQSPGSSPVGFDVLEGEGRVNTVSASAGQNPVTATPYNGFSEATGITFGSGYFFAPPGPDAVHRPKIACNGRKTNANPDSRPIARPPAVVI